VVPPAVRALLISNAIDLKSKDRKVRSKAAIALGELGEQAKPARGLLCRAMLDYYPEVRVAAADALKNIDPKLQYLAVALVTEKSLSQQNHFLQQIEKLGEDGEPLTPLVVPIAKGVVLPQALTTLSGIAKNDLETYKLVDSALDNLSEGVRLSAIRAVGRMKHGRRSIPKILNLIAFDSTSNRLAAIETVVAMADESTEEVIATAIAGQRYHHDERIRKAVEIALNKLQQKKDR
jgi:HEAT repeat protein